MHSLVQHHFHVLHYIYIVSIIIIIFFFSSLFPCLQFLFISVIPWRAHVLHLFTYLPRPSQPRHDLLLILFPSILEI